MLKMKTIHFTSKTKFRPVVTGPMALFDPKLNSKLKIRSTLKLFDSHRSRFLSSYFLFSINLKFNLNNTYTCCSTELYSFNDLLNMEQSSYATAHSKIV